MVSPYVPAPSRIGRDYYCLDDQEITVTGRFTNPSLVIVDNFLSRKECREIIDLSLPRLAPSLEYVAKTDSVRVAKRERMRETAFYRQFDTHPIIDTVEKRISTLLGIPQAQGEGMSVSRYGPGGHTGAHCDYLELEGLDEDSPTRVGGYRICTFLMFLNDVKKGGETYFHVPGVKVQPRAGRVAYFEYCNNLGQLDDDTLHEGMPLEDGEKWIITKWYRQRAFVPPWEPVEEEATASS
jgi:prolyl 4-hydroxylase